MKTLDINTAQIWSLWEICQQAYLRHGRKLSFPAHTDPEKTYQWRYLNALALKFDEWNFDNQTIEKFIDIAVRHTKQVGILHKGLSALHQRNLLELCYETLLQEESSSNQLLDSLKLCKRWLTEQVDGRDPVKILLKRQTVDASPNLVVWYQANKITELFIALSKSCYKSLRILENQKVDEMILLPKTAALYWVWQDFVADPHNFQQAKQILANDWRNLCR